MRKFIQIFVLWLVWTSALVSQTSSQVANVCTYPSTYTFDQKVTWYFDLTGNTNVTAGENLFFWSWTPKELPNGAAPLKYESNMTWSLTFIPTELYGATAAELVAAGNNAFWSNLKNASGNIVTGTIPYELKEKLRKGNECDCIGTPSSGDNTFLINFGSSTVVAPDANNNYWTNVSATNIKYQLLDAAGVHRYSVTASGNFAANNNSEFISPEPAILGNVAIKEATESYMYLSSGSGQVMLSCLKPAHKYRLSIMGSRNSTSERKTRYTVIGAETQTGVLQTSGTGIATNTALNCNDDEFFTAETYPDVSGNIQINVDIETGGFAYINLIRLEEITTSAVVAVQGIEINADNFSASGPSQLTINYTPANTTQKGITWTVSDENIALIDANGYLRPKKEGTILISAVSGFDSALKDDITVTFANFVTTLYLSGTATEIADNQSTISLPMHPVYDADSTITNIFEIYTYLNASGEYFFSKFSHHEGNIIGGDTQGNITSDGALIPTSTAGFKIITVDLNKKTYTTTTMYGWNIVSHMLPKAAGQETWWGGVAPLSEYLGKGVWTGIINFSEKTNAEDPSRYYIELAGTGKAVKQIKGSANRLIFKDNANGIDYADIFHFNGEYRITLNTNNFTFTVSNNCTTPDDRKISVMGSSVAKGYASDIATEDESLYKGYAYMYDHLLQDRFTNGTGDEWIFSNISIGGNTTIDVLNRLDKHLFTDCGRYVIYGLSLANEGITEGGQAIFDRFERNMLSLIDSARAHDIVPVVMSNYVHNSYNQSHYEYVKQMNLRIQEWNVPSVNLLGANDNGSGNWVEGTFADVSHPNVEGYTEFFYAMVPSLFDALADGKAQPTRVSNTYITPTHSTQITFKPENIMHSFTCSFEYKTSQTGTLVEFTDNSHTAEIQIDATSSALKYISFSGTQTTTTTAVNNNQWHNISLTHYYAQGVTLLYSDGVELARVNEKLAPVQFTLNPANAPQTVDYRQWFMYRSAMNALEIEALQSGKMLKSSLELYAPLDGQKVVGNNPYINLAQSTNELSVSVSTGLGESNYQNKNKLQIVPNPANEQSLIQYYQPTDSEVSISLFDVSGKEIASTGRIFSAQGWHELELGLLCKKNNAIFAKGIYMCVLQTDNQPKVVTKFIVE